MEILEVGDATKKSTFIPGETAPNLGLVSPDGQHVAVGAVSQSFQVCGQPSAATGMRRTLLGMLQGYMQPQLIYVAAKLGLADLLQDGPHPLEWLAEKLDVESNTLHRILNGLVGIGILDQPKPLYQPDVYRLNSLGECLISDRPGSLHEVAIFQGEELYAAWGQLLHCVRTGQSAFQKVMGSEFFDYLGANPAVEQRFQAFMTNTASLAARAFSKAYDFSGLETIIDIGGGEGKLLATLLEGRPHLQGILFDIAEHQEKPNEPNPRFKRVRGDFFQKVIPVEANTALILSQVLHDWDDDRAILLLSNCRKALQTTRNVRLLLFENLLYQKENSPATIVEQDLVMLVLTGGRERSPTEFETLLERSGWRLSRVIPTAHSRCILEAWPS